MTKVLEWCRTRPWTWAAVAGVACGAAGFAAGKLTLPTRTEATASASSTASSAAQAQLQLREHRAPVVVTERIRRRPAPGGGVVELVARRYEQGPVEVQLGAASSGTSTVASTEEQRQVEVRDAPRVAAGLTAGTATWDWTPAWGAWLTWRFAGPFTGMVQIEGNRAGGSGRVGLGVTF